MRTPNYILTEEVLVRFGNYDVKTLPKGTFVVPIYHERVPRHVLEDKRWASFDKTKDVFVYTKYGMIAVPKIYVKESI